MPARGKSPLRAFLVSVAGQSVPPVFAPHRPAFSPGAPVGSSKNHNFMIHKIRPCQGAKKAYRGCGKPFGFLSDYKSPRTRSRLFSAMRSVRVTGASLAVICSVNRRVTVRKIR